MSNIPINVCFVIWGDKMNNRKFLAIFALVVCELVSNGTVFSQPFGRESLKGIKALCVIVEDPK